MSKEELFDIDVHYDKLLEWLSSRKKIPVKWQENVVSIREQITNALTNLPILPQITEILGGTYITYYHCVAIFELLKAEDQDGKNLFGQYKSALLSLWNKIIVSYEKDNVYLAECSRTLLQNTNYEIPSLRQTISGATTAHANSVRKVAGITSNLESLVNAHAVKRKKLGVSPLENPSLAQDLSKIRFEIRECVKELPERLLAIHKLLQSEQLLSAISYFKSFVKSNAVLSQSAAEISWIDELVPTLTNASTQMVTLDDLLTSMPKTFDDEVPSVDLAVPAISFDVEPATPGISFDIDVVDLSIAPEISFDIPETTACINWEMESSEIECETSGNDWKLEVQEAGITLQNVLFLSDSEHRKRIVSDLLELEAFLITRISEYSNSLVISQVSTNESESMLKLYLGKVNEVLSELKNERLLQIISILDSDKYVNRLVDSLEMDRKTVCKTEQNLKYLEESIAANVETIKVSHPQLLRIIQETKSLKSNVEKSLAILFQGRPVHIIGEINNVLA